MASNVPKFASFRPKPKDPPPAETKPERSRERERSEKRRKDEKVSERLKDKPAKQAHDDRAHGAPSKSKDEGRVYYVDRKGDPDFLRYGSLNRYEIPQYRRQGFGYVLGLPGDCKIDREQSSDRRLVISSSTLKRRERSLISKSVGRDSDRTLRFIKPVPVSSSAIETSDFIQLPGSKKRKRDDDIKSQNADYRSAERAKETSDPSDSDLESESELEVDEASAAITQTNSGLIQRTRDHSNDLDAWLELVDHQEAMIRLGRVSSQLSYMDRRNLAEVRISTYEQAIKMIGSDPDKQLRLHKGMMQEGLRAWDAEKLTKKWSDVLEKFPSNPELWIQYLDFAQSSYSSFKYDTCRQSFHRCLKALRNSSKALDPGDYLHILIRMTAMIRDSGYQELAIAIWQALLEFHLMGPDSPAAPGTERRELFREFWESETARIGEPDAKGWKYSLHSDGQLPASATILLEKPRPSASVLDDFSFREVDHIDKLRYPGRTVDDVGGEDPFHLVLFEDLEEYLNVLPPDTPSNLILGAFLCFSGMPRLPEPGVKPHNWWSDPFLQRRPIQPKPRSDATGDLPESLSSLTVCQDSCQVTQETLYDRGFPRKDELARGTSASALEDLQFIRRFLKLMVLDFLHTSRPPAEAIGEYLLAFELNYFPDESFKTAKQLIKARPTSLRLYNAYGLLESRRNKPEKADQVYCAALSMHKHTTPFTIPGTLELFNNWVWEALRQINPSEALWRLVSSQGNIVRYLDEAASPPDPALQLRGQGILNEAKERALIGRDFTSAITCTSLLALLAYLCAKQDPYAALEVYAKLSDWFLTHAMAKSPAAELLAQVVAQFLVYHVTHASVVKPALIRDTLQPLIDQFPDNTMLLSVFAANEARFAIEDRVRGNVRRIFTERKTPRNIASWLFAINYEMQRGEIAGSTSNSVRALLKNAEDDVGAHCPAIWETQLLFELKEYERELAKRPNKRPRRDGKKSKYETRVEECHTRVRETFFQGLTHMPWSKDWMMLAFSLLGDRFFTGDELTGFYHIMIEKEMRIYVDVDL